MRKFITNEYVLYVLMIVGMFLGVVYLRPAEAFVEDFLAILGITIAVVILFLYVISGSANRRSRTRAPSAAELRARRILQTKRQHQAILDAERFRKAVNTEAARRMLAEETTFTGEPADAFEAAVRDEVKRRMRDLERLENFVLGPDGELIDLDEENPSTQENR